MKGDYPLDEDVINEPIGRHKTQPHKMTVTPDGKPSTTILKVLERFKEATYVELTLVTGRTHQIRVHASFRHYPVLMILCMVQGKAKLRHKSRFCSRFI